MAKTKSTPNPTFAFKTKAFQDYYLRTKHLEGLQGAYEFLQGIEDDPDYFALMKDSYEIIGYDSCFIPYNEEHDLQSSIHIFIIKRIDPTYIPYEVPFSEDDKTNILEAILGPDWECNGDITQFTYSSEHTYLTIINEG